MDSLFGTHRQARTGRVFRYTAAFKVVETTLQFAASILDGGVRVDSLCASLQFDGWAGSPNELLRAHLIRHIDKNEFGADASE